MKTRLFVFESTGESGQDAGQTADNEDSNSDQSEAKSEEQKQEEAKKEDTASDTANTEDTKEDTSKDKTDAENTNEGELKPNGVNPAIRLTESARTIKVGETFDILSVIDQVVDDQDDVSVLSRRIHADGQYNTSVPGTYTIRYYVMDTNNNTSNIEEFTLTVQ